VDAPTLAIVGGADPVVLDLNRQALAQMNCVKQLHVIPGASHLFEEPGALAEVATLARDWFVENLR
jgi:pimeloyl-ACP methyl ester carboxylesterase